MLQLRESLKMTALMSKLIPTDDEEKDAET